MLRVRIRRLRAIDFVRRHPPLARVDATPCGTTASGGRTLTVWCVINSNCAILSTATQGAEMSLNERTRGT
jgi:hypothetical protein